jgi:DNA-binding response OmpR family regulator
MPTMTGPEAAHEIAADRPIPMIILSAYSDSRTVDEAIKAPVFHYLVKPVDPDDLAPAIAVARARFDEWLDARRERDMLELRLEERKIIERAKGLLMESRRLSERRRTASSRRRARTRTRPWSTWPARSCWRRRCCRRTRRSRCRFWPHARAPPARRIGRRQADVRDSTILVVDDEPLARQMFADLLEAQGFNVISVARGEEAFGFLGEVDLVLLDAMLPGRDGWSICREIKDRHDAMLPIIMVTARTAPDDVVRTFAAGADDYVAKPFHVAELTARIESRLRVHRAEVALKARTSSCAAWPTRTTSCTRRRGPTPRSARSCSRNSTTASATTCRSSWGCSAWSGTAGRRGPAARRLPASSSGCARSCWCTRRCAARTTAACPPARSPKSSRSGCATPGTPTAGRRQLRGRCRQPHEDHGFALRSCSTNSSPMRSATASRPAAPATSTSASNRPTTTWCLQVADDGIGIASTQMPEQGHRQRPLHRDALVKDELEGTVDFESDDGAR